MQDKQNMSHLFSECQMSLARFEADIFRIQIYSITDAPRLEELMYLCNKNQLDAIFTLSLFRQPTSTCFGHICSPPSGGILYIYSNCYTLCSSVDCLLAGLAKHARNMYRFNDGIN